MIATKNQSRIRTYSTTETNTRRIGVAMRTTSPPFSSHRATGISGFASQSASPAREQDRARDHARDEQAPEMMFQPAERIGFRAHRAFLK